MQTNKQIHSKNVFNLLHSKEFIHHKDDPEFIFNIIIAYAIDKKIGSYNEIMSMELESFIEILNAFKFKDKLQEVVEDEMQKQAK